MNQMMIKLKLNRPSLSSNYHECIFLIELQLKTEKK